MARKLDLWRICNKAQISSQICCTSESLGELWQLVMTSSPTPIKSVYLGLAAEYSSFLEIPPVITIFSNVWEPLVYATPHTINFLTASNNSSWGPFVRL